MIHLYSEHLLMYIYVFYLTIKKNYFLLHDQILL